MRAYCIYRTRQDMLENQGYTCLHAIQQYTGPPAIHIRGSKQRKNYGIYYNRDESLSGAFRYRYQGTAVGENCKGRVHG